jgi:hypothetical protein
VPRAFHTLQFDHSSKRELYFTVCHFCSLLHSPLLLSSLRSKYSPEQPFSSTHNLHNFRSMRDQTSYPDKQKS